MTKIFFANSFKRILAFLIDSIIITIFIFLCSYILRAPLMFIGENLWHISFLFFFLYFVILDSKIGKGQTLGKRILDIKTVDEDGGCLTIKSSLVRFLTLSLLFVFPEVSSFLILKFNNFFYLFFTIIFFQVFLLFFIIGIIVFNPEKRGLHEYFSKSLVIKNNSKSKLSSLRTLKEFIYNYSRIFLYSVFFILILFIIYLYFLNLNMEEIENLNSLKHKINKISGISNTYSKTISNSELDAPDLIISTYANYPNFIKKDFKRKKFEQIEGILIEEGIYSYYGTASGYYNVKVVIRTGYDLGVTDYYLKEVEIFNDMSAISYKNKSGTREKSNNQSFKNGLDEKEDELEAENSKIKKNDQDKDGLIDEIEERIGTSVLDKDSDKDGYTDAEEYRNSTDPLDGLSNTDTVEIGRDEILIDWLEEPKAINRESDCKQDFYGCPLQINADSVEIKKLGKVVKGEYKESLLYDAHTQPGNYGNLMVYTGGDKNIILSKYSSNEIKIFPNKFEEKIKIDNETTIRNLGIPKKIDLPDSDVSLILPIESPSFQSKKIQSIDRRFEKIVYSEGDLVIYKGLDSGCFGVFTRAHWSGDYVLDIPFYGSALGVEPKIMDIKWNSGEKNDRYYFSKPLARFNQCYNYLGNPILDLGFLDNISDNDLEVLGQAGLNGQSVYMLKDKEKVKELYNKVLPNGFIDSAYKEKYEEVIRMNGSFRINESFKEIIGDFTDEQKSFIKNNSLSESNFFKLTEDQINRLKEEHFLILWKDPFGDLMIFHKPIFESDIKF